MRPLRITLVSVFVAGLALWAAPVHAGAATPLADGVFHIVQDPNNPTISHCDIEGLGDAFGIVGSIQSPDGTGGQTITLVYEIIQPTKVKRNTRKISPTQSQFSTLGVTGSTPNSFSIQPFVVEKCSIKGTVDTLKLDGDCEVSCSGSDGFAPLTSDQVTSVQAAFTGKRNVKFKANLNTGKWSLFIKVHGPVEAP